MHANAPSFAVTCILVAVLESVGHRFTSVSNLSGSSGAEENSQSQLPTQGHWLRPIRGRTKSPIKHCFIVTFTQIEESSISRIQIYEVQDATVRNLKLHLIHVCVQTASSQKPTNYAQNIRIDRFRRGAC
jgi:hypothetical protein